MTQHTESKKIKVGIVGGTGYTGVELLRILCQHSGVQLHAITSRKEDGLPVATMYPSLRGHVDLCFQSPEHAPLFECDVVFFATPHGVAMAQARELVAKGVKVIDLAADFRIKDEATFTQWYGMPHACQDLEKSIVLQFDTVDESGKKLVIDFSIQAMPIDNPDDLVPFVDFIRICFLKPDLTQ